MITIKSEEEINLIKEGGYKLSRILGEVIAKVRPGVTTQELDELSETLIKKAGGSPAFKGYKMSGSPPFPSVMCTSINNEVVHAPAIPARILKDGDNIGLDIGMKYKNFYTDMAVTLGVGQISKGNERLIKITREALFKGLKVIRPGNLISDIGKTIESYVRKYKVGIVEDLVGHGVGHKIHEDPPIPNYYDSKLPKVLIEKGMVLAIEPMLTESRAHVEVLEDLWTIATRDKGLAAHFEVTVAVTDEGCEILTPLPI